MKNLTATAVFAASLAGFSAAPASAQEHMKADIPFAFRAGAKELPAGTYEIKRMQGVTSSSAYKVSDTRGNLKAMVLTGFQTYDSGSAKPPRLVFVCGSGKCQMAEIWNGTVLGNRLLTKPVPREAEMKLVAVYMNAGAAK